MRRWWPAVALIGVMMAALAGLYILRIRPTIRPGRSSAIQVPNGTAHEEPEIRATGRIEPQHTIEVAAPFGGKVTDVVVQRGQAVVEGELLARIESPSIDVERENALTDLEAAKSHVERLEREISQQRFQTSRSRAVALRAREHTLSLRKAYDRQQILLSQGATPRIRFEESRQEYEQAQAASDTLQSATHEADERLLQLSRDLDSARKLLDLKSTDLDNLRVQAGTGQVLSPVTGTVTEVSARTGDTVDPSMAPIIQIATDLKDLQVNVSLNSSDTGRVKPGMPALIEIAENAAEPLDGVVKLVSTTNVIVVFTSSNTAIRPGLSALVRFRVP
jgi:multidrug resistance efflux pump